MQTKNRAIVIPIYRPRPTDYESLSISSFTRAFKDEVFILVSYKELELSFYKEYFYKEGIEIKVEFFDKKFYKTINTYNILMLSYGFYDRFREYNYILICQTDVYIFSNELDIWCSFGFDYVGAQAFKYSQNADNTPHIIDGIYNGGLSLRKVSFYLDNYHKHWTINFARANAKIRDNIFLKALLYLCGVYYSFFCKYNLLPLVTIGLINEDYLWCYFNKIKKPTFEESLEFAFDMHPKYCYSLIQKLPFGTHAWAKRDISFWTQFIDIK